MEYQYDKDLEFLSEVKSADLEDLVYCITHDADGETRWTEELTHIDLYKLYYPQHNKYWKQIAAEIQCFGANTLATMYRGGKGVEYKEVLMDVCDKIEVYYNKDSSAQQMENNLLMKVLTDALEKISVEDLKELGEALGVEQYQIMTTETMAEIFENTFKKGGFEAYQLTLIVAGIIFRTLIDKNRDSSEKVELTRVMAVLSNPVDWAITDAWSAIDVAGAAYRVTIPAVVQTAVLRQQFLYDQQAKEHRAV